MDRKNKIWLAVAVVWLATVYVIRGLELGRIEQFGWFHLLVSWDPETTVGSFLLLCLPVMLVLFPNRRQVVSSQSCASRPTEADGNQTEMRERQPGFRFSVLLQSAAIAALSLFSSWGIGQSEISVRQPNGQVRPSAFAELPPAYHDEFSYLLQAETFKAGRFAWPGAPVASDAFHQFHVLNEDVTISRYFPLTGFWVAPFVTDTFSKLGSPIWGHWIAGALAAVFFFWSARRLMPAGAALFCGLLLAVSPGLAIFSNMLLAHHPVMLMLSVFLYAFLRLVQPVTPDDSARVRSPGLRSSVLWALVGGCAMSAAMLGRPMTAAGFTAPFGLWLLVELVRKRLSLIVIPAFAVPLIAGFGILGLMNHAATGDYFSSAYQKYTDTFTPRHKYGFGNAENCEVAAGPDAVKKYDQWATNLDGAVAAKNVWLRTKYSLFWTGNLVLLSMGIFAAIAAFVCDRLFEIGNSNSRPTRFGQTGLMMLLASVISLHVVHIPYWYAGIMEWHYVFETAPLILVLAGFGLFWFWQNLMLIGKPSLVSVWMLLLVTGSLLPAWFSSPDVLGISKVDSWINQTAYSRRRMAEFRLAANQLASEEPVLVFVDESNTDPQLSFIINPPNYEGAVIVCRLPQTSEELSTITDHFAKRSQYYFDASGGSVILQPFQVEFHLKAASEPLSKQP